MAKFYTDKIVIFNEYEINPKEDIFERILEERKNSSDPKRFYLKFITEENVSKYNFEDAESVSQFRNDTFVFDDLLKGMGGCNLTEASIDYSFISSGIQISDPYGNIPGIFYIRDNTITYSPILSFFYEQRDLSKIANATYFTTLTFEEIMLTQINKANKFYVHTGDYYLPTDIQKYGLYKLEEVDMEKMVQYVTNPEEGTKIYMKTI